MCSVGIFPEQERVSRDKLTALLKTELELANSLLRHKESLIKQLNGKVNDTDSPNYSIELMLSHNLSLLNSSLINLSFGYLGPSQIVLRTVLENTCLSMYFFEFPEEEKRYRSNRKSFNCKLKGLGYETWVEGWLKRIDNEGVKFIKFEGVESAWYQRIFINLVKEASSFVHVDLDYIYWLVYVDSDKNKSNYALGPNWPSNLLMKNSLWKIIEASLYSCAILVRVFEREITSIDSELYSKAVDELNKWKDAYSKQSTQTG